MQALRELGFRKVLKFTILSPLKLLFKAIPYPPLTVLFLKLLGAKVGKSAVIYDLSFMNEYRGGFTGLKIGNSCFIGNEVMLDLADKITLEDHVTVSSRTILLTHMNTGFKEHPLQKEYPSYTKHTILRRGCFVGAGCILMPGIEIGECSVIGAGSVVTKSVGAHSVVAGNPAKTIKNLRKGKCNGEKKI